MHFVMAILAIATSVLLADDPPIRSSAATATVPPTPTAKRAPPGAGERPVLITPPSFAAPAAPPVLARPPASQKAATTSKALAPPKPLPAGRPEVAKPHAPQTEAAKSVAADSKPRVKRVLFITSADSTRCDEELSRLRQPGGDFERMRGRGWKIGEGPNSHLQVIDREAVPDLVAQLEPREYPAVAYIEGDEIVRSFREGCTTPLDMWTFGWLSSGIDLRPAGMIPEAARVETTGKYRLRGNHWTIDGSTNPTREVVLAHLHGGFHGGQLSPTWEIEAWSYEELRSLHDDLHEKYGGGVSNSSARGRSGNRSSSQFSASRKTTGH